MNIQSQAWADSKIADLVARDGYTEEEARVAARQMQHFTFIYHLADIRGAEFNPSQERDENGRWTGGGLSDNVKRGVEHARQWETTRPWDAGKDALAGGVAGVRYNPSLSSEARNMGGVYEVGDKFFALDTDMRRQVLYHEVGHDLSDAMLADQSAWKLVDDGAMPGAPGLLDTLNGQTTPGEAIAEAYAMLHSEPAFLDKHFPVLATTVRRKAGEMGFPVPLGRAAEVEPLLRPGGLVARLKAMLAGH
jgi:hypothetical protein